MFIYFLIITSQTLFTEIITGSNSRFFSAAGGEISLLFGPFVADVAPFFRSELLHRGASSTVTEREHACSLNFNYRKRLFSTGTARSGPIRV